MEDESFIEEIKAAVSGDYDDQRKHKKRRSKRINN